jgi:hypothetical protein
MDRKDGINLYYDLNKKSLIPTFFTQYNTLDHIFKGQFKFSKNLILGHQEIDLGKYMNKFHDVRSIKGISIAVNFSIKQEEQAINVSSQNMPNKLKFYYGFSIQL